jgi:uncharacterized membrane protein YraQ (UPF0718 family)
MRHADLRRHRLAGSAHRACPRGIIDFFVPDGFVVRALGKRSKVTLVNAVIAGFLMSACPHGILAIAI